MEDEDEIPRIFAQATARIVGDVGPIPPPEMPPDRERQTCRDPSANRATDASRRGEGSCNECSRVPHHNHTALFAQARSRGAHRCFHLDRRSLVARPCIGFSAGHMVEPAHAGMGTAAVMAWLAQRKRGGVCPEWEARPEPKPRTSLKRREVRHGHEPTPRTRVQNLKRRGGGDAA